MTEIDEIILNDLEESRWSIFAFFRRLLTLLGRVLTDIKAHEVNIISIDNGYKSLSEEIINLREDNKKLSDLVKELITLSTEKELEPTNSQPRFTIKNKAEIMDGIYNRYMAGETDLPIIINE